MEMEARRIQVTEAIDERCCADLRRQLTEAAADETVSVIVLHGREGLFCRGLDFEALILERPEEAPGWPVRVATQAFAELLQAILLLPKPLIAEVDGKALGGGVGLAAACDAVVASKRASFGLPETLFGLVPAIIMPVLLERMAPQKIRLLALQGTAVDAKEARALGLVDAVSEVHELSATVGGLVRALGRPEPQAVPMLKQYIRESMAWSIALMLNRGAELTTSLLQQGKVMEAFRKFVSEGNAPWVDRRK
jgi:enoyl-CoA hydratase/carnithine racemase